MRHRLSASSAGVALALALWVLPAAAAEVLRVGGTGGAAALLAHLGETFTRRTGIAVDVIAGLGSSGGIAAAADGVLDLAVSGRPLSAAEQGRGLVQVAAVRTPFVFATSHRSPPGLSGGDIVAAYAGRKATWPDGSPIKLVLRPRADSDSPVLAAMFPGMAEAMEAARRRPELPVAATDQDNADMAERLKGSLTGTTHVQLALERRDLRPIALDGAAPTVEAFESGAYRHVKVFHVVHPRQPAAAAARFVDFLRGEEGARALRGAGCLPGAE